MRGDKLLKNEVPLSQSPCCDQGGEGPTVYDLPVPLSLREEWKTFATRRHFLGRMGKTLGWAGLASLLGESFPGRASAAETLTAGAGAHRLPDFAPKAKRAIYLFMSGAPSQMDLWDYKPGLANQFDKDLPDSVRGSQALTGMTSGQARFPIAPSHWGFSRQGNSGRYVSDLLPWTGKLVDDITLIHTMQTDAINHEPAILLINTGNMNPGKPSLGSWIAYGLGSMNENLPTFVVLNSLTLPGTDLQPISPKLWSSGFLSSEYAGVAFRSKGAPVLYLDDPAGMSRDVRRELIDAVNSINQMTLDDVGDPETNARIRQYELAFRMQSSVPELLDFSKESAETFELYGPDAKVPRTFTYNCLLARRMAERGVRFVQIFHRGWDQHDNLPKELVPQCKAIDQASYALITDLKRRGLLEDTLV